MLRYVIWITLTVFCNFLLCYVATKYNNKSPWSNYLWISFIDLIPTWALASYWSKNLIFDGMLYDAVLVISSVVMFWLLGRAEHFSLLNWVGVVLVIFGLMLVKWGSG